MLFGYEYDQICNDMFNKWLPIIITYKLKKGKLNFQNKIIPKDHPIWVHNNLHFINVPSQQQKLSMYLQGHSLLF